MVMHPRSQKDYKGTIIINLIIILEWEQYHTHRYAASLSESQIGASTGLNISLARKNAESKVFMGQHQAEPLDHASL
jgi:hypothetical protein